MKGRVGINLAERHVGSSIIMWSCLSHHKMHAFYSTFPPILALLKAVATASLKVNPQYLSKVTECRLATPKCHDAEMKQSIVSFLRPLLALAQVFIHNLRMDQTRGPPNVIT
eukprot:3009915-Amphidinium_carterae.1